MKKKLISIIVVLLACFSLIACADEEIWEDDSSEIILETTHGDWAVYWYLCGSDLETYYGSATMDLEEMLEVELPENVNVVIQTGGASEWQNYEMNAGKIQRWLYNSEGLQLLQESEVQNMGDAQTLYEFLDFANTYYPADRVAVTFWNHGGGSVTGAAFDENFGYDSLNLEEMYAAFDAVWPADTENPALELVGFDTCLMATVDVAATFQNFAKYLVASEELEPGNGWLYSGWLGALAKDPDMSGEELGRAICDTYYEGCEEVGTQAQATLSLTDLTALTPLLEAYENFGQEAFMAAVEDSGFFAQLARAANESENYGGNTREQGYSNMVDLGHFARQTSWMLPSAQEVQNALEECILYQVTGDYRAEATGLSCYYSYNGDMDDFNGYADLGTGTAFKHLYSYGLSGEVSEEGMEYLESFDIEEYAEVPVLQDMGWEGIGLNVDEDGTSILDLGPEANDVLAGISFYLFYVDEENDLMLHLGTDNDIISDWENGIFQDNFRGVWGAIDEHLVFMELSFEGEDYNLYSVPILLNGEEYNLQVAYDFATEEWNILGAVKGLEVSGMASKVRRILKEGDVITTIWQATSFSGNEDFEMYTIDEFEVTEDTYFAETELFDGMYAMVFDMRDVAGNFVQSDAVIFECVDGEIYTTVVE